MARRLSQLITDLIDRARYEWYLLDYHSRSKHGTDDRKPGELITNLSQEERNIIQQVTSKDFDHRVDEALKYDIVPGTNLTRRGRLGKYIDEQYLNKQANK